MFLDLKHQALKEVNFTIDIPPNSEVHLESQYSFKIDYNETMSECCATLIHETRDTETHTKFHLSIKLVGIFICQNVSTNEDKKQAHVQAYTLLFPYAQAIIANLTVNAGLPPLMIPRDNFTPENVNTH